MRSGACGWCGTSMKPGRNAALAVALLLSVACVAGVRLRGKDAPPAETAVRAPPWAGPQVVSFTEAMEDPATTDWKKAVHGMVLAIKDTSQGAEEVLKIMKGVVDKTAAHPTLKGARVDMLLGDCPLKDRDDFLGCALGNVQNALREVGIFAKCKGLSTPGGGPGYGAEAPVACGLSALDCGHGSQLDDKKCKCLCKGNWGGVKCMKCQIDKCQNGSKLNEKTCECDGCKAPWQGTVCSECALQDEECNNGKVNPDGSCLCQCEDGWAGDRCDKCVRTAKMCTERGHGTAIDTDKCVCKCAEGWKGEPWCAACARDDSYCQHGGKIDLESCKCDCSDVAPWSGSQCEKCTRAQKDCVHGKLNPETCKCDIDCPAQYKGDLCGTCDLDGLTECSHGSWLDEEKCACVGGEDAGRKWTGVYKRQCNRTAKMCHPVGKGTFSEKTCRCEGCTKGWSGELCDTCDRTDADCMSIGNKGGRIDKDTCLCKDCPSGWGGDLCKKCTRTAESCKNGGQFRKDKCDCECDAKLRWTGDLCESCAMEDEECRNGSKLSKAMCKCVNCNEPWSGDFGCTKCTITAKDCQHGGQFDAAMCRCKHCEGNWVGYKCHQCSIKKAEECAHGTQFDKANCRCVCNQWVPPLCEECGLKDADCAKGKGKLRSDPKAGQCDCLKDCPAEWKKDGDIMCATCDAAALKTKCKRGVPDNEKCICTKCNKAADGSSTGGKWEGEFCDACPVKADQCKNGSKFNKDKCLCECVGNWDNNFTAWKAEDDSSKMWCTACALSNDDCNKANGGSVDKKTCTCKCGQNWKGANCETCDPNMKCKWSTKKKDKCECEPMHQWVQGGGPDKNDFSNPVCTLKASDCAHSDDTLDLKNCRCVCKVRVSDPSKNPTCATCAGVRCKNGVCRGGRCTCRGGWGGYNCDKRRYGWKSCWAGGDPHINTFDGQMINYYSVGEFKYYWNPADGIKVNTLFWKSNWKTANLQHSVSGIRGYPSYVKGFAFEYDGAAVGNRRCAGKPKGSCVVRYAVNMVNRRYQYCFCQGAGCKPVHVPWYRARTAMWRLLGPANIRMNNAHQMYFTDIDNLRLRGYPNRMDVIGRFTKDRLDGMCGTYSDGNRNNDCDGKRCLPMTRHWNSGIQYKWFKEKLLVSKDESLFGACNAGNVWGHEVLGWDVNNPKKLPTAQQIHLMQTKRRARLLDMQLEEEERGDQEELDELAAAGGDDDKPPADIYSSLVWPGGEKNCILAPKRDDAGKAIGLNQDALDKFGSDKEGEKKVTEIRRLATAACVFSTKTARTAGIKSVKGSKVCKNKLGGNQADRISDECDSTEVPKFTDDELKAMWNCKEDACATARKGDVTEIETVIQKFAAQLSTAVQKNEAMAEHAKKEQAAAGDDADGGDAKADGGDAKADGGDAKADGGDAKADGGDAKADGGDAKADGGDAKADGGDAKADAGDGAGGDGNADKAGAEGEDANEVEAEETVPTIKAAAPSPANTTSAPAATSTSISTRSIATLEFSPASADDRAPPVGRAQRDARIAEYAAADAADDSRSADRKDEAAAAARMAQEAASWVERASSSHVRSA